MPRGLAQKCVGQKGAVGSPFSKWQPTAPASSVNPMQPPLVLGDKVWCPRCGEYVKVVRVIGAAKIVDVDRRTVYNYVKKNRVHSVRVAGSTLRVCSHCLLREATTPHLPPP
jgi:hypothetical protein